MTPEDGSYSANATAPFVYDPQSGAYRLARPVYAGDRIPVPPYSVEAPATAPRAIYANDVRTITPVRRQGTTQVVKHRGRDWTKTALVIGGSTASAAGIGAIVGGKKGALVGAALGGGLSTLFEALHR
jgi:hypothetical protein